MAKLSPWAPSPSSLLLLLFWNGEVFRKGREGVEINRFEGRGHNEPSHALRSGRGAKADTEWACCTIAIETQNAQFTYREMEDLLPLQVLVVAVLAVVIVIL